MCMFREREGGSKLLVLLCYIVIKEVVWVVCLEERGLLFSICQGV